MAATVAGQHFEVDVREHYRIANAVYQELADAIKTGRLKPKRWAYLEDRSDELDPTLCVLEAAPILAIAERRGDGRDLSKSCWACARQPAEPPARVSATASEAPPSGIRTNRAAAATVAGKIAAAMGGAKRDDKAVVKLRRDA